MLTVPELVELAGRGIRYVDARTAFEECRNSNGLIIDVREAEEVSAKPVDGTVNIPRGVLEMKMLSLVPDHDRPVFLHCATSARATLAAEQLQRLGYTEVSVISCSIDDICRLQQEGSYR